MSQTRRRLAIGYLFLLAAAAVAGPWLTPSGYAEQNRDAISAPVSMPHPLGTDDLGRDRLARLWRNPPPASMCRNQVPVRL